MFNSNWNEGSCRGLGVLLIRSEKDVAMVMKCIVDVIEIIPHIIISWKYILLQLLSKQVEQLCGVVATSDCHKI